MSCHVTVKSASINALMYMHAFPPFLYPNLPTHARIECEGSEYDNMDKCITVMRQGLSRRMAVAVKIVDANTIVCRTPLTWRALSEASETSSSALLRSSWVFNVSISLNGGHDVSHVNGSDVANFKCADTPLQYGLSMRESDSWYRSTTLCGHFRYVPMWQVDHLVSVDLSRVYDSLSGLCINIHAALSRTSSWLHTHTRTCP
jgi:hypothetical protein